MMNDISDEALSRRIVNILLSKTDFKSKEVAEGIVFWGNFGLIATASQLEALDKFRHGKLTLREVAPVLDDVLKDIESDAAYKFALLFRSTMTILFDFINLYRSIIGTTVILLYLYWLYKNVKRNITSILLTGIQIIFIVTFLVTWWELLHEECIESVPIQCQHSTRQTMDKQPFSPECQMYHDAKRERLQFENFLHTTFIHTIERVTWIAAIFGTNIRIILGIIGILMMIPSLIECVYPMMPVIFYILFFLILRHGMNSHHPDNVRFQSRAYGSRRY